LVKKEDGKHDVYKLSIIELPERNLDFHSTNLKAFILKYAPKLHFLFSTKIDGTFYKNNKSKT
jgi:hypothetical protein